MRIEGPCIKANEELGIYALINPKVSECLNYFVSARGEDRETSYDNRYSVTAMIGI